MKKIIISSFLFAAFFTGAVQADLAVKITPSLDSITVNHDDGKSVKKVRIVRNQNQKNTVSKYYAPTSRKCPPFCVQPSKPFAPHQVDTIGEVELIDYVQNMQNDSSILLIDSRTSDWIVTKSGTIPGAINLPWTALNSAKGASPEGIMRILEEEFNVQVNEDGPWNFSNAKTLVLFCNGMWCGQSPTNIKALLSMGYPAAKIKWYRGGMQNWEALGFSTVKSARIVR